MQVNIVDINKFVKVNDLKEVKSPIYFDTGRTPREDGLFSYQIFGRPGSIERKQVFAYIDLKQPFLHPLVYKALIRINRSFQDVIAGNNTWKIDPKTGSLIESMDDDADTGLDFLYDNWDKLNFVESNSIERKERVDFIKGFKKQEAFMDKQIVIPAFFRDIDFSNVGSGKIAHDEINDKYAKLLRLTAQIDGSDDIGFDFIGNITKNAIQQLLCDIYEYFKTKVEKKRGVFRQAVMGKSIDYAARSVISASNYNMNSYKELKVTFEKSGVPLTQCLICFFPFTMKYLTDFFQNEFGTNKYIEYTDPKTGKNRKIKLDPRCMEDFEYDKLQKRVDQFIKAPTERFEPVKVKTELGYLPLKMRGVMRDPDRKGGESSDSTISVRDMTWTDLFFMCAHEVTRDKHVYITRYPLDKLCQYDQRIIPPTTNS